MYTGSQWWFGMRSFLKLATAALIAWMMGFLSNVSAAEFGIW